MRPFDEEDWLALRVGTLRPGWRGRLSLRPPEENESGALSDVTGTVIAEPAFEHDPADDGVVDATIAFCVNFRDGSFVPLDEQPRLTVRLSDVAEMQAM